MKFALRPFANLALATFSLLANAPAFSQQMLVPQQSEIMFVSRQMGVAVEGRFRKIEAKVAFDPAKLATSSITVVVDVGSVTLGAKESDAELPKPAWFNATKFPQAIFHSSLIKGVGDGKFEVTGKLAIKGVSQDVVVPVSLVQVGSNMVASGEFLLKRLAFKIGENEWADTSIVADDVQVKFRLALSRVGKV